LPIRGRDTIRFHPTPDGAVLLTQTCDAVRPEKPTVAVTPVTPVTRLEGSTASNERRPLTGNHAARPRRGRASTRQRIAVSRIFNAACSGDDSRETGTRGAW
jgi:hypothetical protein